MVQVEVYCGFTTMEMWSSNELMKEIWDYQQIWVQRDGWKNLDDWDWLDYGGEPVLVIENFDPCNALIPSRKFKAIIDGDIESIPSLCTLDRRPGWSRVVILTPYSTGPMEWYGIDALELLIDNWILDVWRLRIDGEMVRQCPFCASPHLIGDLNE